MQQFHASTAPIEYGDDQDDQSGDENAAEVPSPNVNVTRPLTRLEKAALSSWTGTPDLSSSEKVPLSAQVKANRYGKNLQPQKSCGVSKVDAGGATGIASPEDGSLLVACTQNGTLSVFNSNTLQLMDTIHLSGSAAKQACTAIRFRPNVTFSATSNVALVAQGDQTLHVHCTTGRVVRCTQEEGNSINALAVRSDGQAYGTAGCDKAVRVYDEQTGKCIVVLDHGNGSTTAGHSNTIFSLVWKPDDPQVMLSAGWDRTVQVWDLRAGHSVRSVFGPYVCGDALDVAGGQVLTGSWRNEDALQLWDYGTGQLLTNLTWDQPEQDACLIYAAKFGCKDGSSSDRIVAGGSGKQSMCRVYHQGDVQGTFVAASPVRCLEALPASKQVAVACASHLYVLDVA